MPVIALALTRLQRALAWLTLGLVWLTLAGAPAYAAPSADLWPLWQAHDASSTATIDHGRFDALLQKYVVTHANAPNGVRYAQFSSADRESLTRYLQAMQEIDIDGYNRDVQRAYWINLYNAKTLDLVLEHYPVDTIRDIGGSLFTSGPWDDKLLTVKGTQLSLNDIEHRILRPIWHDGLTHYGVNCASISCPVLRTHAYTADNLYKALRANAGDYVNSRQGVHIEGDRITVSKIYDWYASDFGGNPKAILAHLGAFADGRLARRLQSLDRIDDYAYDWSLNDEQNINDAATRQPEP